MHTLYKNICEGVMLMPTINSFIRFLHASPGTPAVDIYTDGNLVLNNLAYNQTSEYLVVGPENMHVQVYPSGEDTDPLLDTELTIPPSETITTAIIGMAPDISLLPIYFDVAVRDNDDALIRFANLSPALSEVSLAIEDGAILFSDVGYSQVTNYQVIDPENYLLQLFMANEEGNILASGSVEVVPRYAFTVYAIGITEGEPSIEISYYSDLIPYYSDQVQETVFRKDTSQTGNAPRINLLYK